jgi:hypothetical protein
MKKKVFILFTTIFLIQFVVSCEMCGGCSGGNSYTVSYRGVDISAYDTSGAINKIIEEQDTVYKYAFGLSVYVESVQEKTGMILPKPSYGFATAMACEPCPVDEYSYPNPISHVEIWVINTKTDEKTNITANFGVYQEQDFISLETFFSQRSNDNYASFVFDLLEHQSIPNSSVFVVETHLESGEIFSQSTPQISFYD